MTRRISGKTLCHDRCNHAGHIPSRLGCSNGGYSTDITKFAAGTGEQLVGDYMHILYSLRGE